MIKFNNVYLKRNGRQIFSGLDFLIQKNEKILVQGKSGIGKTTLFKILLGFETIDSGNVTVNDLPINKAHIKDIRSQIFYLSQDIDLKDETVNALLDEIWKQNLEKEPDPSRFKEVLNFLELSQTILEQTIKELSGGERQRVGLLICFLLNRPVWLLDEPTSALDDIMKQKIADVVMAEKKTIVIISHDDVWKNRQNLKIKKGL